MHDSDSPSNVTIGELSRIVKEFEEKIQNGISYSNQFLSIGKIEDLWGKLIGDTNVVYSDMLHNLIANIDEKDVVKQKKRTRVQRDKT